ncbi:unnamed protein product [Rhizoctonia solani]|uniref:Uncharacterized protein n=1 Tax=Rhizoctonia solani TaxID=456999 RepID=A0A8H3C9H3_9AGAM|nr:unnamed protein product [Rhizoctonia solani]
MVSNPSQYGLDLSSTELASIKTWCDNYLAASDPVYSSQTPAFLAAIKRVYGTVALQDTQPKCLPEAVYVIVVFATLSPQSANQRADCMDLLSKFSFPRLSTELIQYVTRIGCDDWNELLFRLGRDVINDDDPLSKHFAATQLWLLLHLVDDSTTENQKNLRQLLEKRSGLEIEAKGLEHVKGGLGARVLAYYQGDRLDTYSARIIECIYQARRTRPDSHLRTLMEEKMKDVPKCHRGLTQFTNGPPTEAPLDLALVTPLPPSRTTSRASIRSAPEAASQMTEGHWDVDHVSIDMSSYPPGPEDDWQGRYV